MIRAEFVRGEGGAQLLTLRGHATGRPGVCAAASAIVCALAGWLRENRAEDLSFSLKSGDAWVLCRGGGEVGAAFGIALTGLAQLERGWPESVQVHTKDVSALQSVDITARREGAERRTPCKR